MSEHKNSQAVRAQFEAFNVADREKWAQFRVADEVTEAPGAPAPLNLTENWMYLEGFRTAFPDMRLEPTLVIAEGDYVVAHWTGTGTNSGPMRTPSGGSIPPTGRSVVVLGSTTFQFREGKIAREWIFWDMTSLLDQMGLMPDM